MAEFLAVGGISLLMKLDAIVDDQQSHIYILKGEATYFLHVNSKHRSLN